MALPWHTVVCPLIPSLGRDEGAKALSQLADRVPANPTPFIGQLLCTRTRLTAQGRQVKSGEIKRVVFHAELSQNAFGMRQILRGTGLT